VAALLAQRRHDARAAVRLPALLMNHRDLFGQGLVELRLLRIDGQRIG